MNDKALEVVSNDSRIVSVEDQAMSIKSLLGQVQLIREVMENAMKKDEHYGIIPGTKKPTLYKAGAEKICLTFRLNPDFEIIREVREMDFIAYTVKCIIYHIPTGKKIASGIGSCNSRESKYRYRYIEESTGKPVPKKYWEAKKRGDNKEMKRLLQIPGEEGELRAAKIDNQWMIARAIKVENENPWDLDNTLIKMACKRSFIMGTINATAASDIFTPDIDDDDLKNTTDNKLPPEEPETQPGKNRKSNKSKNSKLMLHCPDRKEEVAQVYCERGCNKKESCSTYRDSNQGQTKNCPELDGKKVDISRCEECESKKQGYCSEWN